MKYGNTYLERIYARTERVGDCLIWQGAKHKQGYGLIRHQFNGKDNMQGVHRVMAIECGDFDDIDFTDKYGVRVTHTCGNLLCCNPEHFEIKTHRQVMHNTYKTKSELMGSFHPDKIKEILAEYEQRKDEVGIQTKLANKYGCACNTMGLIVKGVTYKWIDKE